MRRTLTLLAVLLALASMAALAPPAVASGTAISFNLTPPNFAMAPSGGPFAGDTIRTTGSGTFDASSRSIVASGSFTHSRPDGTIVARGTWTATALTSFLGPFGGVNPGLQGGQLFFTATLFPEGGSPTTGVSMSITCLLGSPPLGIGKEGTTVGPFTDKTGGTTVFHID